MGRFKRKNKTSRKLRKQPNLSISIPDLVSFIERYEFKFNSEIPENLVSITGVINPTKLSNIYSGRYLLSKEYLLTFDESEYYVVGTSWVEEEIDEDEDGEVYWREPVLISYCRNHKSLELVHPGDLWKRLDNLLTINTK